MSTPFYIIPLLVEQPTWGGKYIAQFKNIPDESIRSKKIGQSYELFSESFITHSYQEAMPFAYATASNVLNPQFFNRPTDLDTLKGYIAQSPEIILGRNVIQKYGPEMKILIKFTQAQNNSYQVHVCPGQEFGKWMSKPESWYFLEKGKATLGLKTRQIENYKKRCIEIHQYAQQLSQQVQSGEITLVRARAALREFISTDPPENYVNTILVEKNHVVDLSNGGVHHSWEMGEEIPFGNIVYEVQQDILDDYCTLRAFDQGNIKDDGLVRDLTIEEYFQALDTDPQHNNPKQYLQNPASHKEGEATVTTLFDNQYYKTSSIQFDGALSSESTTVTGSFHHLFVQSGNVQVELDNKVWPIPQGFSLFIPANVQRYWLRSSGPAIVLKTYL